MSTTTLRLPDEPDGTVLLSGDLADDWRHSLPRPVGDFLLLLVGRLNYEQASERGLVGHERVEVAGSLAVVHLDVVLHDGVELVIADLLSSRHP